MKRRRRHHARKAHVTRKRVKTLTRRQTLTQAPESRIRRTRRPQVTSQKLTTPRRVSRANPFNERRYEVVDNRKRGNRANRVVDKLRRLAQTGHSLSPRPTTRRTANAGKAPTSARRDPFATDRRPWESPSLFDCRASKRARRAGVLARTGGGSNLRKSNELRRRGEKRPEVKCQ